MTADIRKTILSLVADVKPVAMLATPQGWPAGLYLRKPTVATHDAIAEYLKSGPDGRHPHDSLAYILARLVCTADGERVFDDDDTTALSHLTYDPAYDALAGQVMALMVGPVDLDREGNPKNS